MSKNHDKLAMRLAQIVLKLNEGGGFSISELAEEFSVDARTIQRDLKRLSFLPMEKSEGRYYLASYAMGNVGFEDLRDFLRMCGIADLFPSLENRVLQDLFNPELNTALLIRPANFEKSKRIGFDELQVAILKHRLVKFFYKDKERCVQPYKLSHYLGRWYLLGVEGESIKSFSLEKIKSLNVCEKNEFVVNERLLREIEENKFNFISNEKSEIVLFIDNYAMQYFENQSILPNQKILSKDCNGMEVSTQSSYDEEILKNRATMDAPYFYPLP